MYWYLEVIKKYAVFSGRARRKEYWMFQLVNMMIFLVLAAGLVLPALEKGQRRAPALTAGFSFLLLFAYALAMVIPSLAVSVRRLHDTALSGWWVLIGLIPLGGLVLLVFHLLDSNPGPNRYGPNPKASLQPQAAQYAPYGTQAMASAAGAGAASPTSPWSLGFCNRCGTSLPAGSRFCPNCGEAAY